MNNYRTKPILRGEITEQSQCWSAKFPNNRVAAMIFEPIYPRYSHPLARIAHSAHVSMTFSRLGQTSFVAKDFVLLVHNWPSISSLRLAITATILPTVDSCPLYRNRGVLDFLTYMEGGGADEQAGEELI